MSKQERSPCTGVRCGTGGNSPFTNVFPINGLGANGACNPDGIQLLPGTLRGGGCANGADLTFDAATQKLTGTKNGRTVCEAAALEHATFLVRGISATPLELTIAKVETFTPQDAAAGYAPVEGYRIEYHGHTTCDYETSLQVLNDLGLAQPAAEQSCSPYASAGSAQEPNADLVVAMPGPLYNQVTGEPLVGTGGLFNLACAADALAKTSFYDLDDSPQTVTASLRMITARYDGVHAFTMRGIPLSWVLDPTAGPADPTLVPEAKWDANGKVTCIATPRLMSLPGAPASLPSCLQPAGCGPSGCATAAAWTSALEAQLGVAACGADFDGDVGSGVLFQSYVDAL